MKNTDSPPGQTGAFVLAGGFIEKYGRLLLEDAEGRARMFYELTADADHPHTDPAGAAAALLAGMFPGTILRSLQLHLPEILPRKSFLQQVRNWPVELPAGQGSLKVLLDDYLRHTPIPLFRRTYLELVIPTADLLDWADSVPAQLAPYGIETRQLAPVEIEALARWIFNPDFTA